MLFFYHVSVEIYEDVLHLNGLIYIYVQFLILMIMMCCLPERILLYWLSNLNVI